MPLGTTYFIAQEFNPGKTKGKIDSTALGCNPGKKNGTTGFIVPGSKSGKTKGKTGFTTQDWSLGHG